MKYTTDSTTTQMASTKCQYMAKTPIRSACSCFTYPRAVKVRMIESPVRPDKDVEGVQSHQRVERRSKQAGADGQSIVVDQPIPLARRAQDEDRTQHNRQQPPDVRRA